MEQRLIDANALKVSYCKQCLKETRNEQIEVKQTPYCAVACPDFDVIDKQPTVDAVPISYIYEKASELKNDDMIYAYKVLIGLIANYRADGERKEQDDATN